MSGTGGKFLNAKQRAEERRRIMAMDISSQFDPIATDPDLLNTAYGQDKEFTGHWVELAFSGFKLTIRYNLPNLLKTRRFTSASKSTFWSIKTSCYWPFLGHLPAGANNEVDHFALITAPNAIDPKKQPPAYKYTYKRVLYKQNEQGGIEPYLSKDTVDIYFTFELQTIDFIRAQIASGIYDVVSCDAAGKIVFKAYAGLLEAEDEFGNKKKDAAGEPIYVPKKDKAGNIIKDATGKTIYESKYEYFTIYATKNELTSSDTVDVASAHTIAAGTVAKNRKPKNLAALQILDTLSPNVNDTLEYYALQKETTNGKSMQTRI